MLDQQKRQTLVDFSTHTVDYDRVEYDGIHQGSCIVLNYLDLCFVLN